MHAKGQARLIGVPCHQVIHRLALAEQIVMHHSRPDEVVRAKDLKGPGHLDAVQIALFGHHVLEIRDLAFTDEQHQLTGLGEIDLCG